LDFGPHRPTYWLKAVPDVQARLEAGGRALDVGCGAGRIAVTLAKAFPKAKIVGLDPDRESIRQAEAAAAENGLSGRVSFVASTTGKLDPGEGFEHHRLRLHPRLRRATADLKEIRALLKPEGTLFIIEPRAADKLEDNINPIATMLYGFSIFHCMTQSLAQGGPGLGTCMGPARTEALLREAGFREFRQLDIKSLTSLFYAARG
jgi:ubiquinone/menaquinone biosynthesis C-methylase UbiE